MMNAPILFGYIGMWETVAIVAVVLILFGAQELPGLGRGLEGNWAAFRRSSETDKTRSSRPKTREIVAFVLLLIVGLVLIKYSETLL